MEPIQKQNELINIESDLSEELEKLSLKQEKIGFVFDERMLLHKDFSNKHVEKPERASTIYMNILSKGLDKKLIRIQSEEIKEEDLLRVHSKDYMEKITQLPYEILNKKVTNTERAKNESKNQLCYDTYDNFYTYDAAKISAGSLLSCVKSVAENKVDHAFAIIRPPGHHAGIKHCAGFCFFNNVAIAAKYLIEEYKYKVAIVDWDVHHGDGTQSIFVNDKNPLFISIHRHDNKSFYPENSGAASELGEKTGKGFSLNIPWETFTFPQSSNKSSIGDDEYFYAFEKIVIPVLKENKPDVILISCGFDAAENDPLGNLSVSPLGYSYMTNELKKLNTKMIFALEGGYNLDSLSRCSEAIIKTLIGENTPWRDLLLKKEINNLKRLNLLNLDSNYFKPSNYVISQVDILRNTFSQYWECLRDNNNENIKKKVNKFRKNNENVYSEIIKIFGENDMHKKYLCDESFFSDKFDYLIVKLGKHSFNCKDNNNLKNEKYTNIDNKTITNELGFRLEGVNLDNKNKKSTYSEKHFNWYKRDGIYDVNVKALNYLIPKFLLATKISKVDLLLELTSLLNVYDKLFRDKGLDLYNVDLFIIPMEYKKEELEGETIKPMKNNKKRTNQIKLKLNGFKNYSIVQIYDKNNNNFHQGLLSFIEFLSNNIMD